MGDESITYAYSNDKQKTSSKQSPAPPSEHDTPDYPEQDFRIAGSSLQMQADQLRQDLADRGNFQFRASINPAGTSNATGLATYFIGYLAALANGNFFHTLTRPLHAADDLLNKLLTPFPMVESAPAPRQYRDMGLRGGLTDRVVLVEMDKSQSFKRDLVTEEIQDTLEQLAFAQYAELKCLLGDNFFSSIAILNIQSYEKKIQIIAKKILHLNWVFPSMESDVKNKFPESKFKQMFFLSLKINRYARLAKAYESAETNEALTQIAEQMQEKFEEKYRLVFDLEKINNTWIEDALQEDIREDELNHALALFLNQDSNTPLTINAENIRFVSYFEAFSSVDHPEITSNDLTTTLSKNNHPGFQDLQYAYKIALEFRKIFRAPLRFPIHVKSITASLAQLQEPFKEGNSINEENTSKLSSLLQQATKRTLPGWLIAQQSSADFNDDSWENELLHENLMRTGFPSLHDFATQFLHDKIKNMTGQSVDPNQLTLFGFNSETWYGGHLTLNNPDPSSMMTLTTYLLRNFSQVLRDRILFHPNSWAIYASIYKEDPYKTFDSDNQFVLRALEFEKMVAELDFLKNIYKPALENYWRDQKNRKLEELQNLMRITVTLKNSKISSKGSDIVMEGFGLKKTSENKSRAYFLDINSYEATDMLVFDEKGSDLTILYLPRSAWIKEFRSAADMRDWIKDMSVEDDDNLSIILRHFPLEKQMKQPFYRFHNGVNSYLRKFREHKNMAPDAIWQERKVIAGDVIETMTQNQKERIASDAENLTVSNLEVAIDEWSGYFSVANYILPNPITPFASLLFDLAKTISADNDEELDEAQSELLSDGLNLLVMAITDRALSLKAEDMPRVRTTDFIREKIASPESLTQSHVELFANNKEAFIGPTKIHPANALSEIPPKYWNDVKHYENSFYSYIDPLSDHQKIFLIRDEHGAYIDITTNIEWQPRHYDVQKIQTWETGITGQNYEDIGKFSTTVGQPAEFWDTKQDGPPLLIYQVEHGHYIPPVQVIRSSDGRLQVIHGHDRMHMAVAMHLKKIPYEIVEEKSLSDFHPEAPFSPRIASAGQEPARSPMMLSQLIQIYMDANANLIANSYQDNTVVTQNLVRFLQNSTGISDVTIGNIAYWEKPYTPDANSLRNHFVVFAKDHGQPMVIDTTAQHFHYLGISDPIISSESDWLEKMKTAFDSNPGLLAKIEHLSDQITDARLRPSSTLGPFDQIDNVWLLSDADWYTQNGQIRVKKLRSKRNARKSAAKIHNVGPCGYLGRVLIDKKTSASGLDITQENIERNFKLYRTSGPPAQVLFLSAHGGFTARTGEAGIPRDIKIDFLGPHGRSLADPGIDIINDENWLPFATVDKDGFSANEFKSRDGKQYHLSADQLKANGVPTIGAVKNYELGKYSGGSSLWGDTEETPAMIAKAIDRNRAKTSGTQMDVLTVRNRFLGNSVSLSEVFHLMDNSPGFQSYKKLIFSACRVEISNSNDVSYGVKSMQLMVAEKHPDGWQVAAVLDINHFDHRKGNTG